jgi:hypothetical protein
MTQSWQYPVEPKYVQCSTELLMDEDHDKPIAMGTKFRFSDALACPRKMVFNALGVEVTEPIDAPGVHVTNLGTILHEQVQAGIKAKYPDAEFELKGQVGPTSGSCDGVVTEKDGTRVLLELKTKGGFAFKKAIGVNGYKRKGPEGPAPSAIVQAGLNARAHNCSVVVIMYMATEGVSKNAARVLGLSDNDRFLAEWRLEETEWGPMVDAELVRLEFLERAVKSKYIPQGEMFDDAKWEWVNVAPKDSYEPWVCTYCSFRTACVNYEAGLEVLP